jgi:hypothetical protein
MSERSPSPSPASATRRANEPFLERQPWYRSESWLAVCFIAFIPISLALILPESLKVPLLAVGVVLSAIGLAMLVRKELRRMKEGDTSPEL